MEGNTESELVIREEIVDMKYSNYMVIGGREIEDIDKYVGKLMRIIIVFIVVGILTSILAVISILVLGQAYVFLGLMLYVLACLLIITREKQIISDLEAIREHIVYGNGEPIDVYIFSRESRHLDRARGVLRGVLKGRIESQDILIMGSPRTTIMDLGADALYLFGTIAIANIYMFLSLITFLVFGFCLLYIILELAGKIIDLAATI